MKIGAVTIGQSPRVDVTKDIMGIFGSSVELIQAGGLDGLTKEEIKAFAPEKDDYVLVSRLTDGSSVTFADFYRSTIITDRIPSGYEDCANIIEVQKEQK